MKKFILVLFMVVVTSGSAWAQKGMMGIGADAAFSMLFDGDFSIGGTVKYQYNLSNYLRLEPSFSYYGKAGGDSNNRKKLDMAGLVNMHFFFIAPQKLRPYAIAGIGYGSYTKKRYDYSYYYSGGSYYSNSINYDKTEGDFCVNGGLGLDWRISHKVSMQVEAGVLMGVSDDDHIGLKWNTGICYNF